MDIDVRHHVQLPNHWEVVSRGISFEAETSQIGSEYKCVALPFAIAEYPLHEEIMFRDHDDGIKRGYPGSPLLPRYDTEETIVAGLQPEIMALTHAMVQDLK